MKLEEAKPLSQSLRRQLATENWDLGPGVFFRDRIPFSVRSGPLYAKRVAKLFVASIKHKKLKPPFYCLELGAGLGFLSLLFMNELQKRAPKIYEASRLTVTEGSPSMLAALQAQFDNSAHKDKVTIQKVDILKESPFSDTQYDFIFSTYLLDSLDATHYHYTNSQLVECLHESSIDDAVILVDRRNILPEIANPKSITTDPYLRAHLAGDIVSHLTEKYTEKEPQPNTSWMLPLFEKAKITDTHFTYPNKTERIISTLKTILKETGVILLSDFGFTELTDGLSENELAVQYNVSQFYAIHFPLLRHQLQEEGLVSLMTKQDGCQTQDLLISSAPNTELEAVFETLFTTIGFESTSSALDKISKITDKKHYLQDLEKFTSVLKESEKQDYIFASALATQLLDDGYNELALKWANTLSLTYGEKAVDAYRIQAAIKQNSGNYSDANADLKMALKTNPKDTVSLGMLGMGYMQEHDFKNAKYYMELAIKSAAFFQETLQYYVALAICNRILKQSGETATIVDRFKKISQKDETLIPDGFIDRLEKQVV